MNSTAPSRSHLPALDGLRGLAILLVIVVHYGFGFDRVGLGRLELATQNVTRLGWVGVDLFFVLSGFLITGILLDAKGNNRYYRTFYARRMLRIFPVCYLLLLIIHFVNPIAYASDPTELAHFLSDEPWLWGYLANFRAVAVSRLGACHTAHFWSLAVEEQFYLFWPFLVAITPGKRFRALCFSLIGTAIASRLALVGIGVPHAAIHTLLFTRMDSLALGALLASLAREPEGLARIRPLAAKLLAPSAMVVVGLGLVFHSVSRHGMVMLTAGFTLLAIFFGSLLVLVVTAGKQSATAWFFESPPMRFFGKYSYAIYLYHFPLRPFVERLVDVRQPLAGSLILRQLVCLFVGTVLSTGLALVSWTLLEKPFLSLKKHFEYE